MVFIVIILYCLKKPMKDNTSINKHSGFFLIELLVALGIFSITCLVMAQFHAKIAFAQHESKNKLLALNIASYVIEEIQVLGVSQKKLKSGIFDVFIEYPDFKATQNKQKQFGWAKVAVSWKSLNQQENISIDFGVVK